MSAYNKGFEDVNTLLEILSKQAEQVNDYNTKANTALDKELRDIMIGYRNNEIEDLCETFERLKKIMPEFSAKNNEKTTSTNYQDIGIGDLK